jgi:hypothetical protein
VLGSDSELAAFQLSDELLSSLGDPVDLGRDADLF